MLDHIGEPTETAGSETQRTWQLNATKAVSVKNIKGDAPHLTESAITQTIGNAALILEQGFTKAEALAEQFIDSGMRSLGFTRVPATIEQNHGVLIYEHTQLVPKFR